MPDVRRPQYLDLTCSPNHASRPPSGGKFEQLPDGDADQNPVISENVDEIVAAASLCGSIPEALAPSEAEASHLEAGGDDDNNAGGNDDYHKASRVLERTVACINSAIDRSGEVAGILKNMLNALGGILLDIHNCDYNESTIHPANGLLIQALAIFCGNTDGVQSVFATGDYTIESYTDIFDCWVSKLEEDAEWICQGEKSRKYMEGYSGAQV